MTKLVARGVANTRGEGIPAAGKTNVCIICPYHILTDVVCGTMALLGLCQLQCLFGIIITYLGLVADRGTKQTLVSSFFLR